MDKINNKTKITLPVRKCLRCGHTWVPRKEVTMVCAKCRSPYWNIEKTRDLEEENETAS